MTRRQLIRKLFMTTCLNKQNKMLIKKKMIWLIIQVNRINHNKILMLIWKAFIIIRIKFRNKTIKNNNSNKNKKKLSLKNKNKTKNKNSRKNKKLT